MNDYGNNIILASQAGCDLVLITEEGGDFPVGSNVFYYDDTDGVRQGFDITNKTGASNTFENNQNIAVDWETGLKIVTSKSMFAGSAIKSLIRSKTPSYVTYNAASMFENCQQLKKLDTFFIVPKPGAGFTSTVGVNKICRRLYSIGIS